jgi:catechol 2,3-dioxygenase-like lactoylglutathione lyase family enzyme
MKRMWTIIGVSDVADSFSWYQSLLGQPEARPSHDYFGQILDADGTVLLCLHQWGAHEHPSLMNPSEACPETASSCFYASMISRQRCREHALSASASKKSHT